MAPISASQDEIILLIHGIRTQAAWAEMVARLIEDKTRAKVIAVKYGFFDTTRFLFPFFTRQGPINRIIREYRDVRVRYPNAKISVIAHSFGTYAIAKALEEPDFILHRVIFCGSIVPDTFRVAAHRAQLGDDPILNDCGTHDIWPILAKSVTWGYGSTGTFGFGTIGIRDRFNKFSHSSYFDEEFIKTYWLPFLVDGTILGTAWEVKRPGPPYWQSLLSWLPLRWLPLAGIGIVAVLIGRELIDSRPVEVTLEKPMYVGHWIGISNVMFQLRINNMSSSATQIFVSSVLLASPTNSSPSQLWQEGILNCDGSVPTTIFVVIDSGRKTTCSYSFLAFVNSQTSQISQDLNQLYLSKGPQVLPVENLIDGVLLKNLKDVAQRNFSWESGRWILTIKYQLLDNQRSEDFIFDVSSEDVQRMKKLFDSYNAGYGVFANWRFATADGTQPMRSVSAQKH